MKKFTLMLLAALIVGVAWATAPLSKQKAELQTAKLFTAAQQFTPAKKAQRVATIPNAAIAKKAPARKAMKKVASIDELTGERMLVSFYFDESEETGELVTATPAAGATPVTITKAGENTIAISGFTSDATEDIMATVNLEEGTISIENGQTLFTYEGYGPVFLSNATAEGPIVGHIYENGIIALETIWLDAIEVNGEVYMWTGHYNSSAFVHSNATMTWGENSVPLYVEQDAEAPKYVTVFNFGGFETAVDVQMKEDKAFSIASQIIFDAGEEQGIFSTYGLNEDATALMSTITGVGTETTLTFDCNWTLYSTTGYWVGAQVPAVITLTDGSQFTYPVIPDVAAMPANPEILLVGPYDAEKGYGYVIADVPTTDVDGNDLKESKLFYTFYADIAGEVSQITFTPELYESLTEALTEIPYNFTDGFDFDVTDTYKVVYLNYDFSNYDRIGVQSVYTGGDVLNATEIQWSAIEKPEPVVSEYTLNFNEMKVPVSSNATNDGDITEAQTITEGNVALTISPAEEGKTTPNRFWSTNAGPQLRVYSGTLTFVAEGGELITEIVFNTNGKWGAGNTADSGELVYDAETKTATWTGSAQQVVFAIAGNSQINSIVVTMGGGEAPVVVDDKLVELPEGVEAEVYTLTASGAGYTSSGWVSLDIEEEALVAFDGQDVYVSGLAYFFKDAFVKGQLNADNQVVFKSGQFVGEDEYGKEYLMGLVDDAETETSSSSDFVFQYDTEARTLTLVGNAYISETSTTNVDAEDFGMYTYLEEAVYTPGGIVLPEPVVLPEGVEVEKWYFTASTNSNGKVYNQEIGLAKNGNDLYLQGLCGYIPEAWVKGTINEDGTATFASGQFYGTLETEDEEGELAQYNFFFVGYDAETSAVCDVVFTIDEEAGLMTTDQYIILNGKQKTLDYYDYASNVIISKEEVEVPTPVTAPEDLVAEPYYFTGHDTYFDSDEAHEVKVGFYGENEVYFQGLSDYIEEAWVKGTIEDGIVTIPETFLGTYESLFGDMELLFSGATFAYDAEAGTFAAPEGYTSYEDPSSAYSMDEYVNVVLTKIVETVATPATPTVTDFVTEGTARIKVEIPALDIDGKPMISDKLFYQILVVKEGRFQPLTLKAGEYEELEEDMTVIPYNFTDNWDIVKHGTTIYLNQSAEEIASWDAIGVQSIYLGGGAIRMSAIGWYPPENYDVTGISTMVAEGQQTELNIFDLQGRRVAEPGKGLYIINGKKMVLK